MRKLIRANMTKCIATKTSYQLCEDGPAMWTTVTQPGSSVGNARTMARSYGTCKGINARCYVPAAIQGRNLRERVLEYYKLYPEARATTGTSQQLLFQPIYRHSTHMTSAPTYLASEHPHPPAPTYVGGLIHNLDHDTRIDSLCQELYALERQRAQRQHITQEAVVQAKSRTERVEHRAVRFRDHPHNADHIPSSARIEESRTSLRSAARRR